MKIVCHNSKLIFILRILGFFWRFFKEIVIKLVQLFWSKKMEICAKQMLFEMIAFSILADASTIHKTHPHTHKHLKGTMPQQ